MPSAEMIPPISTGIQFYDSMVAYFLTHGKNEYSSNEELRVLQKLLSTELVFQRAIKVWGAADANAKGKPFTLFAELLQSIYLESQKPEIAEGVNFFTKLPKSRIQIIGEQALLLSQFFSNTQTT